MEGSTGERNRDIADWPLLLHCAAMDASHAPNALYAYPKKGLISALALAAATVVLLSIWGMVSVLRMDNMPTEASIFGCAMLASPAYFIGKLTLIYIRRLLRSGPEIIVDTSGLKLALHSDKVISWDNIQRVEVNHLAKNVICVWLIDPALEPPLRKRGWLERRARHLNDTGDLLFGVEAMTVKVDEVMRAIAFHQPIIVPFGGGPITAPPRR
jgi:hypothetical protein